MCIWLLVIVGVWRGTLIRSWNFCACGKSFVDLQSTKLRIGRAKTQASYRYSGRKTMRVGSSTCNATHSLLEAHFIVYGFMTALGPGYGN